jgi:hypothetical protein
VASDDEDECRSIAVEIQRKRPGWMILFGCYSRHFVAFPLFALRRRVIVTARYPDALVARMDEAGRLLRIRPGRGADPDGSKRSGRR